MIDICNIFPNLRKIKSCFRQKFFSLKGGALFSDQPNQSLEFEISKKNRIPSSPPPLNQAVCLPKQLYRSRYAYEFFPLTREPKSNTKERRCFFANFSINGLIFSSSIISQIKIELISLRFYINTNQAKIKAP